MRKAAKQDRICGRLFIQEPDFEFANFSRDELEQILWEFAEEHGALIEEREKLHEAVQRASSGKKLQAEVKRALTHRFKFFSRNQDWGECLMALAWDNPQKPNGETRPVMKAVWAAQGSLQADFDWVRANYQVDPDTGDVVAR